MDEVTSDASKNPDDFGDALDIIDEQGVAPERILTGKLGICAEGGEFTEVIKKCVFQGQSNQWMICKVSSEMRTW